MTIKVSKTDWDALNTDQQKQISTIISDNFPDQTIEPADDGVTMADVGGVCQIACDVAQAAAIQLCGKLPFGKGICISLAKAAGETCRENC